MIGCRDHILTIEVCRVDGYLDQVLQGVVLAGYRVPRWDVMSSAKLWIAAARAPNGTHVCSSFPIHACKG